MFEPSTLLPLHIRLSALPYSLLSPFTSAIHHTLLPFVYELTWNGIAQALVVNDSKNLQIQHCEAGDPHRSAYRPVAAIASTSTRYVLRPRHVFASTLWTFTDCVADLFSCQHIISQDGSQSCLASTESVAKQQPPKRVLAVQQELMLMEILRLSMVS